MRCWAVTGPMGAGKSSFSQALVSLGAFLVDADTLGHKVLQEKEVIKKIVDAFGSGVLINGDIDRPSLGRLVFADSAALTQLNVITHPEITALAKRILTVLGTENRHALAVFEAAVYFLFPEPPVCDLVISVMAGEQIRIQRVMQSRALTLVETKSRLKSQHSLEKHWETADVVVHNDGTVEELEKEARRLMLRHQLIAEDEGPERELSL